MAKQGAVCAIANTSCCTYINTSDIVEEHADYILQQAKWLQKQFLKTGMGPDKILDPLQDLILTLSGAYSCHYSLTCVWALYFKLTCQFVSSHLESIKLQMSLIEMKMTYNCGPL
jgi:hypothetical protein